MVAVSSPSSTATTTPWIARMPVALFGSVLGVAGLGIAWRTAARLFAVPEIIGEALAMLGAAMFVLLTVLYAAKLARAPAAVKAELLHPAQSSFFGTLTIALTLIAAVALPWSREAAAILWAIGTALQAILVVV